MDLQRCLAHLDEATIDFKQWWLNDSSIRMTDMLDGPTDRHGFVTAHDGALWRDERGYKSSTCRPTIIAMIWSIDASAVVPEPTVCPSRRTVKWSETCFTSSRKCEM